MPPHALMAFTCDHPILALTRDDPNPTLRQRSHLPHDPIGPHPIVGVHTHDHVCTTQREPRVQRRDQPLVRPLEHHEACIACDLVPHDPLGAIARPVEHQHTLPVSELRPHVGQVRPLPLPILARSFAGLFFSYYITEVMLPPGLRAVMGEDALANFVDIYLHGILAPA